MFTGIVEELGTVRHVASQASGARLEIEAATVLEDVSLGDSIAVNGCCLTIVELGAGWWAAEAVAETLSRTCLGLLRSGDRVNLERPVRLADRLGGHLVQGHVDGVGRLLERSPGPDGSALVRLEAPASVLAYVVEKGSIAVDGVSLTVVAVERDWFSVALIPHTLAVTSLGIKEVGAAVNLEVDVIAKYVERFMERTASAGPGGVEIRGLRCQDGLVVDLQVRTDVSQAARTDSLEDALDIAALAGAVREVVAGPPRVLLERLAMEVARRVLLQFPSVEEARVRVRKPEPPGLEAAEEAVELTLGRAWLAAGGGGQLI